MYIMNWFNFEMFVWLEIIEDKCWKGMILCYRICLYYIIDVDRVFWFCMFFVFGFSWDSNFFFGLIGVF